MKIFYTILFIFLLPPFFIKAFSQPALTKEQEIKTYKASIDSLRNLFDSLRHDLTDESEARLKALNFSESIEEGEFYQPETNSSPILGGFGVYTFTKNDTVLCIRFAGGKNDTYVTKRFYYQNHQLVFSEMTVRLWKSQTGKPFKTEECYLGELIAAKKTENPFPKIVDKSLIPDSLYADGMKYIKLELQK